MYHKGDQSTWAGRKDPGSVNDVWHQAVDAIDLNKENTFLSLLFGLLFPMLVLAEI